MVGAIHRVGIEAKIGMVIRPTEVEKTLVEIKIRVVEVEVRAVIRLILYSSKSF